MKLLHARAEKRGCDDASQHAVLRPLREIGSRLAHNLVIGSACRCLKIPGIRKAKVLDALSRMAQPFACVTLPSFFERGNACVPTCAHSDVLSHSRCSCHADQNGKNVGHASRASTRQHLTRVKSRTCSLAQTVGTAKNRARSFSKGCERHRGQEPCTLFQQRL